MEKAVYWIWLQQCYGYGKNTRKIFGAFSGAEEIYFASDEDRKAAFSPVIRKRLRETDLSNAIEIYRVCEKHGIILITPDSELYPKRLLETQDYPLVLYVRGNPQCFNREFMVAVIGSRTPSAYGREMTEDIVKVLTKRGALIVSGGALGVDSAAHKSAIENGAETVLVMGVGHGSRYLSENSALRKSVSENGALITEYPPHYETNKATFPQRNRIISGMSDCLAVVEAAERSGTFSTANHAKKQGKRLFVLPGDVRSGNFDGSHILLNEGADYLFSGNEILSSYGYKTVNVKRTGEKTGLPFETSGNLEIDFFESEYDEEIKPNLKKAEKNEPEKKEKIKTKEKTEKNLKKPPEGISKNAEIVYNVMSEGEGSIDGIVEKTDLPVNRVLSAITELEILSVIFKTASGTYSIEEN